MLFGKQATSRTGRTGIVRYVDLYRLKIMSKAGRRRNSIYHKDVAKVEESELFFPPPPSYCPPKYVYSYYYGMTQFYSDVYKNLTIDANFYPYLPEVQRYGMLWGRYAPPAPAAIYQKRESKIYDYIWRNRMTR